MLFRKPTQRGNVPSRRESSFQVVSFLVAACGQARTRQRRSNSGSALGYSFPASIPLTFGGGVNQETVGCQHGMAQI